MQKSLFVLSVFITLAHNNVMRAEHNRAEPITPPGVRGIDKEPELFHSCNSDRPSIKRLVQKKKGGPTDNRSRRSQSQRRF